MRSLSLSSELRIRQVAALFFGGQDSRDAGEQQTGSYSVRDELSGASRKGSMSQPNFKMVGREEVRKSVSPLNRRHAVLGKDFSEADGLGFRGTLQSIEIHMRQGESSMVLAHQHECRTGHDGRGRIEARDDSVN